MSTQAATTGLFWEEWTVGRTWVTAGRTMTEAAIEACAGLSGDYNPLHTDQEFAQAGPFGTRVAHGPLVYLFAAGLLFRLHLYDDTLIAFLGFDRLHFTAPVQIGDTVHARIEVTSTRETSRPDRGVVTRRLEVLNQRGEVVLDAIQSFLIRRRPFEDEGDAGA